MKKVLSMIAVAAVAAFVACGPSAEEKAQLEERAKEMQDSISATITESMQNETAADTAAPATTGTETTTAAPAAEGHEGHGH